MFLHIGTFFIVCYIVSFYGSYKLMQEDYSQRGRFRSLSPGPECIFWVFMPLFNAIPAIEYYFRHLHLDIHINNECIKKFFKIKD